MAHRELPTDYGHIRKCTMQGNVMLPGRYFEEMHITDKKQLMLKISWDTTGTITLQPIDVQPIKLPLDDLNTPEDTETVLDRAKNFLRDALQEGPIPSTELYSRARVLGMSRMTLRRAKDEMEILSYGGEGKMWFWKLINPEVAYATE